VPVQDVDATFPFHQDLRYFAATNMYSQDQGIVMQEMHEIVIFFCERDWPARRCRRVSDYCLIVIPPGFVDVVGSLLGSGAFYRRVSEDDIHLSVLDKGVARVFLYGIGLPLYFNLRG